MKRFALTVLAGMLALLSAFMAPAADFPLILEGSPALGEVATTQFVHDRSSRVLILCYHRFAKKKADSLSITDKELRAQLQKVVDAGFEYISMDQFLAWRRGEANIPPLSALVTVDDGFRSTLDLAHPIFSEFGVPYVIYAYTDYVGNGSQALTWDQLRKLSEDGVTIANHSASHSHMAGLKTPKIAEAAADPEADKHKYAKALGSDVKSPRALLARLSLAAGGDLAGSTTLAGAARWSQVGLARDPYEEWLWKELYGSRVRFRKELGFWMPTFAYPYGAHSDRVAEMGLDAGYEALFTVNGEEVNITTAPGRVHRFVIMSDRLDLFDKALIFRIVGATPEGDPAELPVGVTVVPGRHEVAALRQPEIVASVKPWLEAGADPTKLSMRLSGFGEVPFTVDPASGVVRASSPAILRGRSSTAVITGADAKGEKLSLRWSFLLPPPSPFPAPTLSDPPS